MWMNSANLAGVGGSRRIEVRRKVEFLRHTVAVQVSSLFRRHRPVMVAAILVAVLATGCNGGTRPTLTDERLVETPDSAAAPTVAGATAGTAEESAGTAARGPGEVEALVVEVLEIFPHDTTASTQGLELHNGVFLESTGLYGRSDIRRVDPATGNVLQVIPIDQQFFAEGLTRVDDQVIQLTWRENTAFYWDAATLERIKEVSYAGDGWGLCYDGSRLIMTDGTPQLTFRDPMTFDETGRIPVTLNGEAVYNLNEVECVNGMVWANIWQTEFIARIDPATGVVTGLVDAIALDAPTEPENAVLNGIAWDASTQSFYVTGKLWPNMYRVNFVPAPTG